MSGLFGVLDVSGHNTSTSSTGTFTCPSVTTTVADTQVFYIAACRQSPVAPPSITGGGIDLLADAPAVALATNSTSSIVRTQGQAAAGAVPARSFYQAVGAGNEYFGVTLAFRPQSGAKPVYVSGGQQHSLLHVGENAAIAASYSPAALQ